MKLSNKLLIGGAGFLVLLSCAIILFIKIGIGSWLEKVLLGP